MISDSCSFGQTYPVDLFSSLLTEQNGGPLTIRELEALKRGEKKRFDERSLDQQRPVYINAEASMSADGSAYAELGNTKLYCVVSGPREIGRSDTSAESSWKASLAVKITYAPFAFPLRMKRQRGEQESAEERAYSSALTDAFTAVVLLERYPRSQIDLLVTVIEDDGGVLPLALTACSVALANAGIETYDVAVAASLVVVEDHFMMDPTLTELLRTVSPADDGRPLLVGERAQITFGLMPSLNQVICVNQEGQLKPKNFSQALKLLAESCYRLYPVVQQAIAKSVRRQAKEAAKK